MDKPQDQSCGERLWESFAYIWLVCPGGLRKQDALGADHAELWSIMALASLQNGAEDSVACRNTARSLVPNEHGFQLGHIKVRLGHFYLFYSIEDSVIRRSATSNASEGSRGAHRGFCAGS